MTDEPIRIGTEVGPLLHTKTPGTFIHRNVFEQVAAGGFPVKINGKTVGTGKLGKDGAVEMEIFDEEAKALLNDGTSVGSLSIDYTSKTITAIMKNRKRKGL